MEKRRETFYGPVVPQPNPFQSAGVPIMSPAAVDYQAAARFIEQHEGSTRVAGRKRKAKAKGK